MRLPPSSTYLPIVRLLAIVIPATIAMLRARAPSLKFYLFGEAAVTIVLEMALLAHWPYAPIYLIARPLNFITMYWVARPNIGAGLTAIALAWTTYLTLPADIDLVSATAIIQGALFILFGVSAVKPAPLLAILWMLVGAFNLAFAHGWTMPAWANLNQWWSAMLYAAIFTLMAATSTSTSAANSPSRSLPHPMRS